MYAIRSYYETEPIVAATGQTDNLGGVGGAELLANLDPKSIIKHVGEQIQSTRPIDIPEIAGLPGHGEHGFTDGTLHFQMPFLPGA